MLHRVLTLATATVVSIIVVAVPETDGAPPSPAVASRPAVARTAPPSEASKPGTSRPAVARRPIPPDVIGNWIARLDSDEYAVRERATRRLIEAGPSIVEPLAEAAEAGSLEMAVRATRILEEIYTSTDEKGIARTEATLERLTSAGEPSVAVRARDVLERNYGIRRRHALREIERLGGEVVYGPVRRIPNNNRPRMVKPVQFVRLGTQWKGGDQGLRHIERLDELETLYLIEGANVSEEAIAALTREKPQLRIQRRGRAYLGVGGQSLGQAGCQIITVKEGSAADKGGIRQGDIIVGFDGQKVKDFDDLIALIKKKNPGDEVSVKVQRRSRMLERTVTLTGWK